MKEQGELMKEVFNVRTRTPGNTRRHWSRDAKEAKEQRTMVCNRLKYGSVLPPLPAKLMLTRYGPRKLDKHNTWGAMKHIIDGVADAYGIDDSDARLVIEQPKQEKAKQHAVMVEIETV